ncbi:MAG TPA: tetratricopeptide repeat protein [Candidatus Evtepia faecigallinarum]|nr:tetratricopeptide repeat protein [Candidatus Evtepia faecigallinarum]
MEELRKSKLSVMMLLLCTMLLVGSCEQEPTWQTLYDAGIQYTEEGNYDQAIASFEDAIALDANKPEAYSALADVYVAMENLEKALEVLQQGIDATGDDGLKARVEEISAKLEELAGPQKPEYMVDYLGMTVNEIAALWGEDYTVMDDLYLGDKKGIYYEDSRTMTGFYFLDPAGKGVQTGEEKIILIETSERLLQIMCKPPEWCKIEASHRRFYYDQKESHAGRKGPAGENPRTAADGEYRQHG